jgi:hypothetical protein
MDPLHLPLKVDDRGQLVRSDRKELLVQLLRIMVLTNEGTWAPDPEFGLRQHFEPTQLGGAIQQKARDSLLQSALDSLNRSLERLGMTDFRVTAVERIPGAENGVMSYAVTAVSSGRGPEILELKV